MRRITIDLGEIGRSAVLFYDDEMNLTHLIETHLNAKGEECGGHIPLTYEIVGYKGEDWEVVNDDPRTLTIYPSIRCTNCKSHGYIVDGEWTERPDGSLWTRRRAKPEKIVELSQEYMEKLWDSICLSTTVYYKESALKATSLLRDIRKRISPSTTTHQKPSTRSAGTPQHLRREDLSSIWEDLWWGDPSESSSTIPR